MKITLKPNQNNVNYKDAMKYDIFCRGINKFTEFSKKLFDSAAAEIAMDHLMAQLNNFRSEDPRKIEQKQRLHQLKAQINKTGKGNTRKNIIKGFK